MGLTAGTAQADEPTRRLRGGLIEIDPLADNVSHAAATGTIWLDRCDGGCTIQGTYPSGPENAANNQSRIVSGTRQISEWRHGDAQWNALVSCVKGMYERFGVEVTDVKPTSGQYFRSIVAGYPQEAGYDEYTGGVAPFACGVINNSINYSFANGYSSVQQICEVVAQESAHVFGLDHEFHCPDPMTYLYGCGAKEFRDYNAQCGEDRARSCRCGGTTQNSVQMLYDIFGPGELTPPTVQITEPAHSAIVEPGFVVRLSATDNREVTRVELWINGELFNSITNQPWVFNGPTDLPDGGHIVEVRAYDNYDTPGSDSITVIIGQACACAGSEVCVDGRCVPGPDDPGGLGAECTGNDECVSGICGTAGETSFCAESCVAGNEYGCPSGFSCTSGVCWPSAGGGGGGCSVSDGRVPLGSAALALMVGVLLLWRRRRY